MTFPPLVVPRTHMWLPYGRGTADGVTIASRDASLDAKGPVRSILSLFVSFYLDDASPRCPEQPGLPASSYSV